MKTFLALIAAIAMTSIVQAQDPAPALPGGPIQEIERLEAQIADAVVRRDIEFVQRVWADDFVYTGIRGEIKNKADVLAELKAGDLRFETMKFEDLRVRVYGDAAIATGKAIVKGRSPQGPIAGEFRYTRVYVKQDAAWRLAAFQATREETKN